MTQDRDIWSVLQEALTDCNRTLGFVGPIIDAPGVKIRDTIAKEGDDDVKHEDTDDGA